MGLTCVQPYDCAPFSLIMTHTMNECKMLFSCLQLSVRFFPLYRLFVQIYVCEIITKPDKNRVIMNTICTLWCTASLKLITNMKLIRKYYCIKLMYM